MVLVDGGWWRRRAAIKPNNRLLKPFWINRTMRHQTKTIPNGFLIFPLFVFSSVLHNQSLRMAREIILLFWKVLRITCWYNLSHVVYFIWTFRITVRWGWRIHVNIYWTNIDKIQKGIVSYQVFTSFHK